MMSRSHLRGHLIYFDASIKEWRYRDNHARTLEEGLRDCGKCGKPETPEGHDGCLGTLPGVMNACCGHGCSAGAYVQLLIDPKNIIRGSAAICLQNDLKKGRDNAG